MSIYISEEISRQIVNAVQEIAKKAIMECGNRYDFDGEEAIRYLGLENVKIERKRQVVEKKPREVVARPAFPLPYNGELNEACCFGLRQNNGLYTQCQAARKGDASFCKGCQVLADKNDGTPEYGTIQQRQAVDIFMFVDPKGRKPVHYTKVMKKYKVSSEQVLEEASKFNIKVNPQHLEMMETEKRGRPASKKNSEAKGPKGRPKKSKKVLEISGDNEELTDLFAAMVLDVTEKDSDDESVTQMMMPVAKKSEDEKSQKKAEEKAVREAKKAEEKADREAKLAAEKAEKDAKLAAEKADREAKKEAERLEREAKKSALEEEKASKEAQRLKEKEEREAKKKANEEKKANKKPASKKEDAAAPAPDEEEEGDRVDTIKVDGKKYLVSPKTGIVYDYSEWKNNQEQVVLGKYNKETQKIEFKKADDSESDDSEEEEEDYEEAA
jgi:chemotaxis protein histidine kinase CheA